MNHDINVMNSSVVFDKLESAFYTLLWELWDQCQLYTKHSVFKILAGLFIM